MPFRLLQETKRKGLNCFVESFVLPGSVLFVLGKILEKSHTHMGATLNSQNTEKNECICCVYLFTSSTNQKKKSGRSPEGRKPEQRNLTYIHGDMKLFCPGSVEERLELLSWCETENTMAPCGKGECCREKILFM